MVEKAQDIDWDLVLNSFVIDWLPRTGDITSEFLFLHQRHNYLTGLL